MKPWPRKTFTERGLERVALWDTASVRSRRVPRSSRSVVGLAASAVLVSVGLTGCVPPADVSLGFDEGAAGTELTLLDGGSDAVVADVVARNGGTAHRVEHNPETGDLAARFPSHDPDPSAPRAVVRVIPAAGAGDPLNPGTAKFSFGADVAMDEVTATPGEGSIDDGDNLVQRGLFNAGSQYKLQVDSRRPSCRILGADGEVFVQSPVTMTPGTWYRIRCSRDGDTVTLIVAELDGGDVVDARVSTKQGPTGDMTPTSPNTPLSVGGKLNANGTVTGDTDQLNGMVDDAWLRIG